MTIEYNSQIKPITYFYFRNIFNAGLLQSGITIFTYVEDLIKPTSSATAYSPLHGASYGPATSPLMKHHHPCWDWPTGLRHAPLLIAQTEPRLAPFAEDAAAPQTNSWPRCSAQQGSVDGVEVAAIDDTLAPSGGSASARGTFELIHRHMHGF